MLPCAFLSQMSFLGSPSCSASGVSHLASNALGGQTAPNLAPFFGFRFQTLALHHTRLPKMRQFRRLGLFLFLLPPSWKLVKVDHLPKDRRRKWNKATHVWRHRLVAATAIWWFLCPHPFQWKKMKYHEIHLLQIPPVFQKVHSNRNWVKHKAIRAPPPPP